MSETVQTGTSKKNQVPFEIRLDWLGNSAGIITSNEVKDTVHVELPASFGGGDERWSPEHLFLSSIASCFMTTLTVIAQKMRLPMTHFTCRAKGKVEPVDGKYRFTSVDLFPKISVENEQSREKAQVALEKAKRNCLVADSTNVPISYHETVMTELPAGRRLRTLSTLSH